MAVVSWAVVLTIGVAGFGPMPGLTAAPPAVAAQINPAAPQHTVVALPSGSFTVAMTSAPAEPIAVMQPATFTTDLPDGRAAVAVATAMAQIGLPYVWGGDGPTNGDAGFDCSGLTTFSYAAAGLRLPRTAHTQYYAGPHVPAGAPLQPGDLLFYGTPTFVHHVGMYIGAGRMVNAPTFGKPVQTAYYRWDGDDYLGATRPAASGSGTPGLLLTVPRAEAPPASPEAQVFAAPPAPLPATPLPDPTAPQPPEADTSAAARAATEPAPLTTAPDPTTGPTAAAPTTTSPTPTTTVASPTSAAATPTSTTTPPVAPPTAAEPAVPPATTDPVPTTTPPAPATTTPPAPATTITVSGSTVPVAAVRAGADGLPRASGLWSRPDRPVLRLPEAVAGGAAAGSVVTITRLPAAAVSYTVQTSLTATTAEAAAAVAGAPAGTLVVVIPLGSASWTVLTAS